MKTVMLFTTVSVFSFHKHLLILDVPFRLFIVVVVVFSFVTDLLAVICICFIFRCFPSCGNLSTLFSHHIMFDALMTLASA